MKRILTLFLFSMFFLVNAGKIHAEYVFPYPSYMPGNKLYRISRLFDIVNGYWHFGNLAKINYHLALSDKYFIEAKTLFEYKQYLLAYDALLRSNVEFEQLPFFLNEARKKHIDTTVKKQRIQESAVAAISYIERMKAQIPSEFVWTPEKGESTKLPIMNLFDESVRIRKNMIDMDTKPI